MCVLRAAMNGGAGGKEGRHNVHKNIITTYLYKLHRQRQAQRVAKAVRDCGVGSVGKVCPWLGIQEVIEVV